MVVGLSRPDWSVVSGRDCVVSLALSEASSETFIGAVLVLETKVTRRLFRMTLWRCRCQKSDATEVADD